MKIAFLWAGISGYMADNWRALANLPGVSLMICASQQKGRYGFDAESLMRELNWVELPNDIKSIDSANRVREHLVAFEPDIVFCSGWHNRAYRSILSQKFSKFSKVLCLDTPWRGSLKQRLGLAYLKHYSKHFDLALVAGARSSAYAEKLGFPPTKVVSPLYAVQLDKFANIRPENINERSGGFVYVGRYSVEKGLDTLMRAFEIYQKQLGGEWGLSVFGKGDLEEYLFGHEGVQVNGFIQPNDLPELLGEKQCFILPSRYEPWGVVVAEACHAGLPVICSDAVGAADDLVSHGVNGFVFKAGDAVSLADMMSKVSESESLQTMGSEARKKASGHSSVAWAQNIVAITSGAK